MFGRSVQHCDGCGRGIPAGRRACPRCSKAAGPSTSTRSSKKPRRCGRADGSFSGCGGFVPGGGRCDRCGK